MSESGWHGLYGESWTGVIVPEAFGHPAKYARGLIRHIYQHAVDEGWLKESDTVLDCFGGVGLGAWPALRMGINWVGVELEEKFVDLGNQNLDLWNGRYRGRLPKWGEAVLLQGDSRELASVIGAGFAGMISSPPWCNSLESKDTDFQGNCTRPGRTIQCADYGSHPAQLGNMREGEFRAVISSPAYAKGCQHTGGDDLHPEHVQGGPIHHVEGGSTPGQLAAMPEGDIRACISSPPMADSTAGRGRDELTLSKGLGQDYDERLQYKKRGFLMGKEEYQQWAQSCNLGSFRNATDTFWSAARQIVQQVYQVLAPGSHAIWITKRFVRSKRIVEFSQQWAALCESVGFVTVHWHKAWLVEDRGTQAALIGEDERLVKKRYSFFRRLHASKYPHLEIQWEDVICMVKR